jgi:exopolyphosphatase/guanosine-5'-triphosphate,3'-diphosphate pyrophosphatase
MDHVERTFLACASFARHTAASDIREPRIISRLLGTEQIQRARALGAAIRLACDLSGRNPELLGLASIEFRQGAVILKVAQEKGVELLGELAAKRGATLAAILDRELKIRPAPARVASSQRVAVG